MILVVFGTHFYFFLRGGMAQNSWKIRVGRTVGAGEDKGVAQPHPHILADQLTLSQPGGQIMPATLLLDPRIFRPSYGPGRYTRQRSTWEGPHHLNFFDDHASGIGYLRFRQQKARLATSFLNVPTANLGLIP